MTTPYLIRRIEIRDYLGIKELAFEPPPEGALVTGENGQGKTSVLKAIAACLTGVGAKADSIRLGADFAEITIDLNDARVRRVINRSASSLTVSEGNGVWTKPQHKLSALLGATLDPLAFYLAKPAERRALLLGALPIKLRQDQIARWLGPAGEVCGQPPGLDGMHGLEALERLREHVYNRRTVANADAAAAQEEADRHPFVDEVVCDVTATAAAAALEAADRAAEKVQIEAAKAEGVRTAQQQQRAELDSLRGEIATMKEAAPAAPSEAEVGAAALRLDDASKAVRKAREALQDAEDRQRQAREAFDRLEERANYAHGVAESIRQAEGHAARMEASIAPTAEDAALAARLAETQAAYAAASRQHALARAAEEARATNRRSGDLRGAAVARARLAADLDAAVKALTNTAPVELAQSPGMIPGLEVTGDRITLDGKAIDGLCGAEQLILAITIAKRATTSKAKILVVDGLERLSESNLHAFLAHATADGWQLLGTRVADGDLVVQAIAAGE